VVCQGHFFSSPLGSVFFTGSARVVVQYVCSMWIRKPTRCHLVLYLFLLYKLLNMFRANLCPSSGADDLVIFFHVWCSAVAV